MLLTLKDGAKMVLENTIIEHFTYAVTCASDGELIVKRSTVANCDIGLSISNGAKVESATTQIRNCSQYGIVHSTDTESLFVTNEKKRVVNDLSELRKLMS